MTPAFLIAKILDISLVSVYYFSVAFIASAFIDKGLGKFDEKAYAKVSTLQISAEILLHLIFLGVLSYVLRNIVERIPFPLEGFGGFQHVRLKENQGGVVLSFMLLFFQNNLTAKIQYLHKRLIR